MGVVSSADLPGAGLGGLVRSGSEGSAPGDHTKKVTRTGLGPTRKTLLDGIALQMQVEKLQIRRSISIPENATYEFLGIIDRTGYS